MPSDFILMLSLSRKIWMLENDLENRTKFLIKRIKRLETKQLEKHVKKQLKLFVHKQNNTCCQDLKTTVGVLLTNLKHLESCYDSDTTESSSGGESCDELENVIGNSLPSFSRPDSNPLLPTKKKSTWKWLDERSAIGLRWTWLQAQVADLEFKIRQQNEIYRQHRASKGSIAFYCKEASTTLVSTSTTTVTTPSSTNNNSTSEDKDVANPEKEILHCARTLPLKQMRKRKLTQSNAFAGATRKIARCSTVLCSCPNYPRFVSPCVLCNGRYSNLQMIDTDCMHNYERYALLDPSYHPVLSLPNDVALGVYFSKILKKETIQKAISSKHPHKRRSNHSGEFSFKFGSEDKKINRRKSQTIISSTKLKKKYDGTTKKKFAKGNHGYRKRSPREKNNHTIGSGDETRTESSSPSPLSSENSSIHRRRRSEHYAYDINNIVIPYSIASTTRVEKLTYKEIITPKWRYVEAINNLPLHEETEETDEDTSDEMFAVRHSRCEIDERKQFSMHLRNPSGAGPGRDRSTRTRLDSTQSDGGVKNTVSKITKKSKNNNNLTSEGHINPNLNESTQHVDLSSQDFLVTAPINLYMISNNIGDSSPTKQIRTSITLPVTTTSTTPTPTTPTTPLPTNCNAVNYICDSEALTTHGPPAKTTIHRTSSSLKREDSVEDSYLEVQPFEKRQFPISDHQYQEMLRMTMMRDDDVSTKEGEDGRISWRISQNCDDSLISDGDNATSHDF